MTSIRYFPYKLPPENFPFLIATESFKYIIIFQTCYFSCVSRGIFLQQSAPAMQETTENGGCLTIYYITDLILNELCRVWLVILLSFLISPYHKHFLRRWKPANNIHTYHRFFILRFKWLKYSQNRLEDHHKKHKKWSLKVRWSFVFLQR